MTLTKRKVSSTFKREISLYSQERIYPLTVATRYSLGALSTRGKSTYEIKKPIGEISSPDTPK
jgi:hypothetical protein